MRELLIGIGTAVALGLLGGEASASSQIINMDALDSVGVTITFDPGTYNFSMIGVADGGAYDAWNPWGQTSCTAASSCDMGWTNAFDVVSVVGVSEYIPAPPAPYAWSTALGSLNAWKGYPETLVLFNGSPVGTAPNPGVYTFSEAVTLTFRVGDGDGAFGDNLGGVSLRVTSVPEPAAWALMLLGFGAAGTALRRSRKPAVA